MAIFSFFVKAVLTKSYFSIILKQILRETEPMKWLRRAWLDFVNTFVNPLSTNKGFQVFNK